MSVGASVRPGLNIEGGQGHLSSGPRVLNLVGLNDPYKCMCIIQHGALSQYNISIQNEKKKENLAPITCLFAKQKGGSVDGKILILD